MSVDINDLPIRIGDVQDIDPDTSCEDCDRKVADMNLTTRLIAKPIGTYSIAGAQPKAVATETVVLECECGWFKQAS